MNDRENGKVTLKDLFLHQLEPEYVYVIEGDPVALARHRHSNYKTWDPQKQLKLFWGIELKRQHNDRPLYAGPLSLEIDFYFDFPKQLSMKKREELRGTHHVYRPDLDNCIKFICDVANNILYKDDCTISCISAQKRYDTVARTEFTIKELSNGKKAKKE